MSSGAISDIKEARKIIAQGENLKLYTPNDRDDWEKAYETFKQIIKYGSYRTRKKDFMVIISN